MQTIRELRKYQYDYHRKKFSYLYDWKRNPYTFFKARFYMESSAILVYFLLKTRIKPNTITILYGLAGVLGCILLAIPTNTTHIIAILIFFTKGVLDWSDGHFARITGQTSVTGHVLDIYGAFLNDLSFQLGLGFYVALKTEILIFYYLIPLIPFFYTARLHSFARAILFKEMSKKNFVVSQISRYANVIPSGEKDINANTSVLGKYAKYSKYFSSFLDSRARTVDFICLLILIEMVTNISITWIIFVALVLKGFISCTGIYYITIKNNFIEKSLDATIQNVRNAVKDDE